MIIEVQGDMFVEISCWWLCRESSCFILSWRITRSSAKRLHTCTMIPWSDIDFYDLVCLESCWNNMKHDQSWNVNCFFHRTVAVLHPNRVVNWAWSTGGTNPWWLRQMGMVRSPDVKTESKPVTLRRSKICFLDVFFGGFVSTPFVDIYLCHYMCYINMLYTYQWVSLSTIKTK